MATAVFILIAYLIGSLPFAVIVRSEEHTSELQSLRHLVCRLLLEKKKKQNNMIYSREKRNTNPDCDRQKGRNQTEPQTADNPLASTRRVHGRSQPQESPQQAHMRT